MLRVGEGEERKARLSESNVLSQVILLFQEDKPLLETPAGVMGNSAEFRDCLLPMCSKTGDCKSPQTAFWTLQKLRRGCSTPLVKLQFYTGEEVNSFKCHLSLERAKGKTSP